jgi:hypothetical protein
MADQNANQAQAQAQAQAPQQQLPPIQAVVFQDLAEFLKQEQQKEADRAEAANRRHQDRLDNDRAMAKRHLEATQRHQTDLMIRRVPHCDGLEPQALRLWLREVDMSAHYTPRTVFVAAQTATGSLRLAIEKFLSRQPNRDDVEWPTLKKHIISA